MASSAGSTEQGLGRAWMVKVVVLALVAALNALVGPALLGGPTAANAADPCGPAGNKIACENSKPGTDPDDLGHQRRGRLLHPGLRHRHLGQRRPAHRLQDQDRRLGLHDRHLPDRLVPGPRRAQDHLGDAERVAAAEPAQLHHRRHHRALRLRQLGGLGVVERADHGRVRRLHRPPQAQQRRLQPHHLHRARRRQHLRRRLPDLRPDVAGLQHLRRLELLPAAAPTAAPTSSATTARFCTRGRHRRARLLLRQRVRRWCASSSATATTCQLHGRRRLRPPRQPASRTTRSSSPSGTTSTGAAPSAPTSRRRATPG